MGREVLVLNSDYEPLNICNLHRAIGLLYKEKADVLHYQGEENKEIKFLYTISGEDYALPSVIRLRRQIKRPRPVAKVSRRGIYIRDNYSCQYCGSTSDLTLDHVIPRRMGGEDTWENLVTCCKKCNGKKSDKPLDKCGLILKKNPRAPKYNSSLGFSKYLYGSIHEIWKYYLPTEGESMSW